jgi:multidrug efflux pump
LIPVFYVSVRRMLGDKLDEPTHKLARHEHEAGH